MSPEGAQLPRRSLVYLSGAPGVGKSTLMEQLTRYCSRTPISIPFAHDLLGLPPDAARPLHVQSAVELGRRRDAFSGTDALSMAVQPVAQQYISRHGTAHALILGEGDRLANAGFLGTAVRTGWHVTLIHLDAPDDVLDARCAARGTAQNTQWRRGRRTKARNLAAVAAALDWRLITLDARNSVACLTASAVALAPILAALLPPDAPERDQ